ncbi:MAG: DUF2207 domain-containing protein [Leptolyngbya sp. SIO1D8]|nr:DUF2207 domain-containing protein [Leptolyngbya sp. SIO1D8]
MISFQKVFRYSRWLLVGFWVCWLSFSPVLAQADSPFYWDFINVDITLQPNGDLLVTETQKYQFTANHTNERYRYIPSDRVDKITDIKVYENDTRLPIETGIQDNQYWIRWRHDLTPPESHTFVLKYRVIGGVQTKVDISQIYWRALFSERDATIRQGRVTIHLPEALSGKVISFKGEGTSSMKRQITGNKFEFVVDNPLPPQQFLDVKVRFPAEILNLEKPQWQRANNTANLVGIGSIFGGVAGCLLIAVARRRCPSCGKLTLNRLSRVRRSATRRRSGRREIRHFCDRCDYRQTYIQTIPPLSTNTGLSSNIYGGSCGSSGAGGSGGGGAGGGGGGG